MKDETLTLHGSPRRSDLPPEFAWEHGMRVERVLSKNFQVLIPAQMKPAGAVECCLQVLLWWGYLG